MQELAARESLEDAVTLLDDLGEEWGRDQIVDGARAVIARLVRKDPERATALVLRSRDPWDRAAWLESLAWWLELVPPAVPLVEELLARGDPELDLALARILTRTPALDLLDRALGSAAAHDPLELAASLAPGVYQLRAASRHDPAERVRRRCLEALRHSPARPGTVSPTDLFEVLAAPGPCSCHGDRDQACRDPAHGGPPRS